MGEVVEINGKYYVRKGGEYLGIPGHYSSDRFEEIKPVEKLTVVSTSDKPKRNNYPKEQEYERKRPGADDDKFFFKVMVPIFVAFFVLVMWGLYWR